jgi:hypothetical protein
LCRDKKISATLFAKVTDISHFTPGSRRRGPTITPTLCHLVPFMSRISKKYVGRALPAISFNQ